MLTGTTRIAGAANIITGVTSGPARAARNSVWPGYLNPASYSTLFWIGLVTTPEALSLAGETHGALYPRYDRSAVCRIKLTGYWGVENVGAEQAGRV